ncbi:DUF4236 domain-containing protein [Proteus sp. G2662]|uniref:DUF4236 domain-containing protein n=1 Tax=Proteus sp. G2662 TaxID=2698875 RepID=UPI001377CBB2|nr:DUF4236 domain-containing protein [Proteus sp. G2662]NBM92719.1 DUF4236 domain-containing protein [Proteus sp. G2662]
MGFKFRKRIKIAPGIHINVGKTGVSTSIGKRGSTINIGKNGTKATFGLPGTGLSYSTKLSGKTNRNPKTKLERLISFFIYIVLFLVIYSFLK